MPVIDASAAVELILAGKRSTRIAQAIENESRLDAPEIIDLEFLQAFRGLVRAGSVSDSRANQAIVDFDDLQLRTHGHRHMRKRIWELRHGFSAYDAAYVSLAEMLDTQLITCDARLSRAVSSHGLRIECVLVR